MDAVKREEPQRWKTTLGDLSVAYLKAWKQTERKPEKVPKKAAKNEEGSSVLVLAFFMEESYWMLFFVYQVSEAGSVWLLSL